MRESMAGVTRVVLVALLSFQNLANLERLVAVVVQLLPLQSMFDIRWNGSMTLSM